MPLAAFHRYLRHERRFSEHTLAAYRRDTEQFAHFLQGTYEITDPAAATAPMIRSWLVELLEAGRAAASIRRKLSSLKSLYHFLREREGLAKDPTLHLPVPKLPRRLPPVIPAADLARLLDHLRQREDFSGRRDAALLEVLYGTGIRRGELLQLTLADIDSANGRLRVRGKGDKERLVPFGKTTARAIETYLDARRTEFPDADGSSFLLTDSGRPPYPKWVYNKVCGHLAAITTQPQRGPHTLRHSFATHLTDNGADLNAVKSLLGHANLAATQRYTHNSIEKIKQVYRQAHPKSGS